MATVTEAVKEGLIGTTQPPDLTQEARARFMSKAQQDKDGEWVLNREDFIELIAPPDEDYVSVPKLKLLQANL